LLRGFQLAGFLSFLTHALHRIHDRTFLCEEGVAQVGSPLNVVCQALRHVRQSGQGLHTGVPRLLLHGISEGLVLQSLILCKPLLKLNDFERISGCRQDLGQQWIWIKGDGRNKRIQLFR
jgi:hypothetical protein